MAYVDIAIKDGDFYIIETLRCVDGCQEIKDYFDRYIPNIDEMVVLPIVEFMKKGYETVMSCSGHSFYSINSCYKKEALNYENVICKIYDEDAEDTELFFLDKSEGEKRYWIAFDKDYFAGIDLPCGWKYSINGAGHDVTYDLYCDMGNIGGTELMLVQIEKTKQLLEWIRKLPKYN